MNDIKRLELLFFEVLQDLKDYLDDLTLVGVRRIFTSSYGD